MLFQKEAFRKRSLLMLIVTLVLVVAIGYAPGVAGQKAEVTQNFSYEIVTGLTKSKSDQLIIKALDESIAFMEERWGTVLEEPVKVYLYKGGKDFKKGLENVLGFTPKDAEYTSRNASGLANGYLILISKENYNRFLRHAPNLIKEVICHEIIHIFQNDLYYKTNGRERANEPLRCLKEGYAYLTAAKFVGEWNKEREEQCIAVVQHLLKTTELIPDLTKYQTFDEYNKFGEFYGWRDFKIWMIFYTNYLLDKFGEEAVATYFAGRTGKEKDTFKAAFGYTYNEFQDEITHYFKSLKEKPLPEDFNNWFGY